MAGRPAYGTEERDIRESFRRLDRDGDGAVSTGDLRQLGMEFFYSEDPEAPGNWLVGPL